MKEYKVPVQSLIDHIKTATDVDPWANDMATELLERDKPVAVKYDSYKTPSGKIIPRSKCGKCGREIYAFYRCCPFCLCVIDWGK